MHHCYRHPEIFSQLLKADEATDRLKWLLFQAPSHLSDLSSSSEARTSYYCEHLNVYHEESKNFIARLIPFLSYTDELICLSTAKLIFDLFMVKL